MKTDICSLAHILRTMCQGPHLHLTIESTNTLIYVHHCRLHLFIDWVFPQVLRSGDVITWPDLFSCIPIFTGLLAVGCHGLYVSACQLDNNSWWSWGITGFCCRVGLLWFDSLSTTGSFTTGPMRCFTWMMKVFWYVLFCLGKPRIGTSMEAFWATLYDPFTNWLLGISFYFGICCALWFSHWSDVQQWLFQPFGPTLQLSPFLQGSLHVWILYRLGFSTVSFG